MSGNNNIVGKSNTDMPSHTTGDMDPAGKITVPGVRLWDHRLVFSGGGVTCEECEMEEEVPELLQMSSGFRQVLWKLYVLGKFKDKSCVRKINREDVVSAKEHVMKNTVACDRDKVNYLSNGTTISNRKI